MEGMACAAGPSKLCGRLTRKKSGEVWFSDSQLKRCLNTLDLTSIGVGTIVASGLYVVTGELARDVAGPAIVIAFLIAAVSATLSGICYAEFGCRLPKAGSAYVYSYVTLGEIWAFIVGWNMVLEYLIAAAALSRASSEYINSLTRGFIYKLFMRVATWEHVAIAPFPDFLALTLAICMATIVSLGARKSSVFNKIMALVNLLVIVFIICVGLYFTDFDNWTDNFAPYGVDGILTAASSCFYAFVGFDVIATASEEAINPKRSIPLSIVLSMVVSTIAYFGVATVLTLMIPYHKLARFAPLAEAFVQNGLPFAKYIVSVGGLCATLSSLMTNSFAAPRVIYSMAIDGLLLRFFSHVSERTHVPVRADIAVGLTVGILALIFDIKQLVEMLSIGTLIAYTMVAIAVLLTRFQPDIESVAYDDDVTKAGHNQKWLKNGCCATPDGTGGVGYREVKKGNPLDDASSAKPLDLAAHPTAETSYRASVFVAMLTASIAGFCIVITTTSSQLSNGDVWAIFLASLFALMVVASLMFLMRQPRNTAKFPFTVPFVPLLPTITIFVNVLLLVKLNHWTYIRFAVWMTVGALIYTFYGYTHSIEGTKTHEEPNEFIILETPRIQQEVKEVQRFK